MQKKIGHLFKLISDRMKANGDAKLKEKNLTFTQSQVLRYVRFHEGKATQKEIEEYLSFRHGRYLIRPLWELLHVWRTTAICTVTRM